MVVYHVSFYHGDTEIAEFARRGLYALSPVLLNILSAKCIDNPPNFLHLHITFP